MAAYGNRETIFPAQESSEKKRCKPNPDVSEGLSTPTSSSTASDTENQKENLSEEDYLASSMQQAVRATSGLVNTVGPSWFRALESQFNKQYFIQLGKFVAEERKKHKIFPPENQVFAWTSTCDISQVKVVILGQDPYHNVNQAHGFAFSVQKGVAPPPSLVNMFTELEKDIDGFKRPGHGDLTGWARQGVLLLNAVLTVRAHQANSHKDKGWEKFTDSVISYISENMNNVVFILWGAYAQKKGAQIKKGKHLVLSGPHPSPLSAHRGFFGCRHFSKANEYLKLHNKDPIIWSDL